MKRSLGIAALAVCALLAGLAALFKAGLFKNADDEDDKDAKALANAEGRQGVQMNLSAILRYLQGGDAAWKDGDELMKIDWLEPMNAFLAIASLAADSPDFPSYVDATLEGTLQSVLDMPVMETLSNIFDNYRYSREDSVKGKLGDVGIGFATDALTGMLPAPVSQTARAMDPYYRETVGSSKLETGMRQVMNAIPGLRQQLPEKLDNFGRAKRQADSAYNRWMNSFVRPGQISDYKAEDVDIALDHLAERTGDAGVYPDRKAPNSFSAGGQKYELTTDEKLAYQETYGKAAQAYFSEILLGDEYRDASDGEKQWLLDQAKEYATYQAKKAIMEQRGETYSNSSWDKMDALEENGGNPFGYGFEVYKDKIWYRAFSPDGGQEFGGYGNKRGDWVYYDVWQEEPSSDHNSFSDPGCVFDGVYMFCAAHGFDAAIDTHIGGEMWYFDGEKVQLQMDFVPGNGCDWIKEQTVAGGSMYWWNEVSAPAVGAYTGALYRLDSKEATPVVVTHLDETGDFCHSLRNLNGTIIFASDKTHQIYVDNYTKEGWDGVSDFGYIEPEFGNFDSITEVREAEASNNGIYNLNGMRVSGKLQKGVYIVNGKKVVVR